MFVPNSTEIENARYLDISAEQPLFQTFAETASGGVTFQTSAAIKIFTENGQTQLKSRGLEIGVANPESYEDFHVKLNDLYLAVMECKGGEASVFPALAQGCVMSTNFCIKLLNEGIAREQCIIPVIANNGLSMVFGATILLIHSQRSYL